LDSFEWLTNHLLCSDPLIVEHLPFVIPFPLRVRLLRATVAHSQAQQAEPRAYELLIRRSHVCNAASYTVCERLPHTPSC
jgi:hypothetical protein